MLWVKTEIWMWLSHAVGNLLAASASGSETKPFIASQVTNFPFNISISQTHEHLHTATHTPASYHFMYLYIWATFRNYGKPFHFIISSLCRFTALFIPLKYPTTKGFFQSDSNNDLFGITASHTSSLTSHVTYPCFVSEFGGTSIMHPRDIRSKSEFDPF